MSSAISQNPVRLKRIYDDYRTVQMSRCYYARRLPLFKRCNLGYEIILAVGASSTAAGWYLWRTPAGKIAWAVFAALVAVLAILKPILQLPKEIERYSKLHIGYSDLYYDLRQLVDDIQGSGGITQALADSIINANKRYKELALQDDAKPRLWLLRECQAEVNRKVPSFKVWCPKSN